MNRAHFAMWMVVLLLGSSFLGLAQQAAPPQSAAADATVPTLVQFSGTLIDSNGKPLSGIVGVTFYLYQNQQGGTPLWMETQNVQPNKYGHYTVQLGSATSQGLPSDLFASGEARWLGVQAQGQAEQPRVMLLSVPYALKAGDAATVGGLPPSAFMLAPSASAAGTAPVSNSGTPASVPSTNAPVTGLGTVNFLPLWDTTSDILSSAVFQSGTGATAKIGINTTKPASSLDVVGGATVRGTLALPSIGAATASGGRNSQAQTIAASSFNSGTGKAVSETFQWQAEPAGNDTATPSGTLNLLFGSGTNKPAETGLNIASNGQITFAAGQTFPGTGTGTITGVTAGTGLTGGGNSGNVTLNLDPAKVPLLGAANTFTANQTVSGTISATQLISNAAQGTAPLQVTSTTQVANLNASFVGGLSASAFQPAGSYATLGANTFSGTQQITGANLALDQTTGPSAGVVTVGGSPFLHTCCASNTTFVGSNAGSFSNTGGANTAVGTLALGANTSGMGNTAVGSQALPSNTGGFQNVAIGVGSLGANTTGGLNVAVGVGALNGNTTPNFNTAVGGFALNSNSTGTRQCSSRL